MAESNGSGSKINLDLKQISPWLRLLIAVIVFAVMFGNISATQTAMQKEINAKVDEGSYRECMEKITGQIGSQEKLLDEKIKGVQKGLTEIKLEQRIILNKIDKILEQR